MRRKLVQSLRVATIGIIAVSTASLAHAATIITDRTVFESMLGSSVTDDYSGYPGGTLSDAVMSAVLGETGYTSTGFSNNNFIPTNGGNHYCAGCNGSYELDFTSTSVGTSDGVFGVGLDIVGRQNTFGTVAFVTYGTGETENIAIDAVGINDGDVFWGFKDARLISMIHFGLIDGGTNTNNAVQRFAMDNLTIGSAGLTPVPLPTALPLLAGGLGLMGFMGWRRKRKAATA